MGFEPGLSTLRVPSSSKHGNPDASAGITVWRRLDDIGLFFDPCGTTALKAVNLSINTTLVMCTIVPFAISYPPMPSLKCQRRFPVCSTNLSEPTKETANGALQLPMPKPYASNAQVFSCRSQVLVDGVPRVGTADILLWGSCCHGRFLQMVHSYHEHRVILPWKVRQADGL